MQDSLCLQHKKTKQTKNKTQPQKCTDHAVTKPTLWETATSPVSLLVLLQLSTRQVHPPKQHQQAELKPLQCQGVTEAVLVSESSHQQPAMWQLKLTKKKKKKI